MTDIHDMDAERVEVDREALVELMDAYSDAEQLLVDEYGGQNTADEEIGPVAESATPAE